jgi:tripartite-type tricarboxylate transporter receptor subunit TctC
VITRRCVLAASLAGLVRPAGAASYPERVIKLIVPFAPGGPVDVMARLVAQDLSARFGQPVVVENRPGAGGTLASKLVATAEPDGYTLLFASAGSLAISPSLYKNLGYDPVGGFAPVAIVANHPIAMAVHPSVPVHSVKELVDYAKANPGVLNFGAAPGTPPHLMVDLFCSLSGIKMVFVPYKGAAPALTDLLAGQVTALPADIPVLISQIKGGNLISIGQASNKRDAILPDVPTLTEQGYPNTDASNWYGLLAPAKTPAAVITKINSAVNAALKDPATRDKLVQAGATPVGDTPESFGTFLKAEYDKWGRVVKERGIHE